MICSFTTRFRSIIWFLILTFTLYSIPHFEYLLPYKFHISVPEAQAAEAQVPEPQANGSQNVTLAQTPAQEVSSSKEPPPPKEPSGTPGSPMTLTESGSSQSGISTISFSVDDFTGAAHLNYPIIVPPGRDGLTPTLSLIYNSNNPNGWIGVGWDIPIGFIERRGARKGVLKYDSTDIFVLNLAGAPLDLVSIGGGEYRLRVEGASYKIQYNSTNNYWEVWDKSGVKMRFGYTADSRINRQTYGSGTFRWCIDRVDDPKTNYMEVTYQKDMEGSYVNQLYPQKIQYNGQVSGNLPHNHEITFNLETSNRTDLIYNFRGGFKQLTRKRLSSIDVKTSGNLVRRYQLQYYSNSNFNVRSRLNSVTLYGNDNVSTLPATTFTYQTLTTETARFSTASDWSNYSAWNAVDGNFIQNSTGQNGVYTDVIDMNGDARPERVVYSDWCY
jgi:hypothetical protein